MRTLLIICSHSDVQSRLRRLTRGIAETSCVKERKAFCSHGVVMHLLFNCLMVFISFSHVSHSLNRLNSYLFLFFLDVAFKVGPNTNINYIVVNIHYLKKVTNDRSGLAITVSEKP
jgi:hypothetical protein